MPEAAPTHATTQAAGLAAWRKRMTVTGAAMALAGVVGMAVGGVLAGVSSVAWQGPVAVGTVGVFCVVIGAFLARLGVAGPYPRRFTQEDTP